MNLFLGIALIILWFGSIFMIPLISDMLHKNSFLGIALIVLWFGSMFMILLIADMRHKSRGCCCTTISFRSFLKLYNFKPELWRLSKNHVEFLDPYTRFTFRPLEKPIFELWRRQVRQTEKRAEQLRAEADAYSRVIKGMRRHIRQDSDKFSKDVLDRVTTIMQHKKDKILSQCTITISDAIHSFTQDWK